ncbi:MAG: pilus assembly protein TadB [Desulfuromonas sp.]|nr:MAG: pilus assembly protein TadB [Desulfuromonas sp.]
MSFLQNIDLLTIGIFVTIFIFAFLIVQLVYLVWMEGRFAEKRKVKRRLLLISAGGKHGEEKLKIYRDRALRDVGVVEKFMLDIPRIATLDRMLLRANLPINATSFSLGSLALGMLGFLVGTQFLPTMIGAVVFGLLLMVMPFVYLRLAELKSLKHFDEQLPEALDLLARAVRSGHALSSGMEMVADEMEKPISHEFSATIDEINLGLSLKEALDNLVTRVPSRDLRFFAISILIQKETGGNIAEIFDNISRLIRERHQFARQVSALTAEGRLSGLVLCVLPILMFGYIYVVNYEYISLLWDDIIGIFMLAGGISSMLLGTFFIKKIVQIEI